MSTTVCCLLYGDFPELANRCLKPISKLLSYGVQVRAGCNEVSTAVKGIVETLLPASLGAKVCYESPQIFKYPMMTRLFQLEPITTDYVMWFDDDSYITQDDPVQWLKDLESFMRSSSADMVGSIYVMPTLGSQEEWRRLHCSWYSSNTTNKQSKFATSAKFATGGWWMIKSSIINKYGWPHPMLKHRGGDVLLGELIRSQGLKLINYKKGIAINADANGKESASKRRGYDEPPIGIVVERKDK